MNRWLKAAAISGIAIGLASCAAPDRQPQLDAIEANVDATYDGEFGALLYDMYQAGVKAEEAADAKAHLEADPPYLTNHAGLLEDAVTASEEALAHREAAEAALDRYLEPLRARIAYLEALHVPDISGMFSLPIFFDTGSATVKASEAGKIAEAADLLSQYPIAAVSIVGFTDMVGTPAANDDLALRRAEAVVAALRDTGVPVASSVAVIAAGEAIGADQVDDPMNRRVDILITPHGAAAP
jgi:outer membrane protein OmpA-like peptidoglycan-associated protein